jgi:hypothetical protein
MTHSLTYQQLRQENQVNTSSRTRRLILSFLIIACLVGVVIGSLVLFSPWIALAITLGIVLCIAALSKPVLLCYIVIAAAALTSGMERGELIPLLRPNEAFLLLCAGIAFTTVLTRKSDKNINLHPFGLAIIFLVGGTMLIPAISYLLRRTPLTFQDILTFLAPLQYVLLFWLFTYLPANNLERRRIIQLMLFCGAIVAAIGLLQGARIGFVTDLLHKWYGSTHEMRAVDYGRVTSLMSAWNVLGIFLMVNLFIAWAFGISRPVDLGTGLIAFAIGICIACLILSGSFAGLIGAVLGISILTFLLNGVNKRTIMLFLVLLVVILSVIVFFKTLIDERLNQQFGYGGLVPQTLVYRFKIWQEIYWPAVQKNILWGINPTIPTTYSWQYIESQYLALLFSFGLIGLFAYLLWIGITVAWLIHRFRQHHGLLKPVTAIAITTILVLSVAGFTNAVFTYSGTADYLWILLALVASNADVGVPPAGERS